MSYTRSSSLFRQSFLHKLRLKHSQMSVRNNSTLQGPVPHRQPDVNLRVEVRPGQGSDEDQQNPVDGLPEPHPPESIQPGDESEKSDHQICIEDFPNEILEKIISNLSGISLLSSRQVSRRWNLTVRRILNVKGSAESRNRRWEEICLQIFPENILLETIQRKFIGPSIASGVRDEVDWRGIFKGLQACWAPSTARVAEEFFDVSQNGIFERIVQVVSSNELIIMNHPSGRLSLWSSETETLGDIIGLSAPCNVGAIALGDFFRKGPYKLGQGCHSDHHFLVAGTQDGQVSVHGLAFADYWLGLKPFREDVTLQAIGATVTNVTIFGDLIVVAGTSNGIAIWKMSPPHPDNTGSKLPSIVSHMVIAQPSFLPSIYLTQTAVWPNRHNHDIMSMTSVSATAQKLFGSIDESKWKECSEWKLVRPLTSDIEVFHPRMILLGQETSVTSSVTEGATSDASFNPALYLRMIECTPEEKKKLLGFTWFDDGGPQTCVIDRLTRYVAYRTYVFHDNLFVMLTHAKMLLISVDGIRYRCYNTMLGLGGDVTAVAYHAGLLLLGTSLGRVFAFKAKQTLAFMSLDLFAPAWFEVLLRGRPVQSLHISHSGRRVCLTAAFNYLVKCITWTTEDSDLSV